MAEGHKPGARFKKLVEMGERPGDCWKWLGSVNKKTGYGKKQWHGKTMLAHRWVWEMFFGKIPDEKVINHLCGNRSCVNPHHLEVTTMAGNCRHGNGAKVTPEIVEAIRNTERKWGDRLKIARRYGISPMTVSDIRNGRSWIAE